MQKLSLIMLGLVFVVAGASGSLTARTEKTDPVFMGKTIPQWIAVLKDPDPDHQSAHHRAQHVRRGAGASRRLQR